jgi:hypothetical protein
MFRLVRDGRYRNREKKGLIYLTNSLNRFAVEILYINIRIGWIVEPMPSHLFDK